MDDPLEESETLRERYCPPLDEALFNAIVSDYELPREREALVEILDSLKEAAITQESVEFDPSGTGGLHASTTNCNRSGSSQYHDDFSNDITSATSTLSDLQLNSAEGYGDGLQNLTDAEKLEWLQASFPRIAPEKVVSVLSYNKGDLYPATDELLNLSFLDEDSSTHAEQEPRAPKGVDGFLEPSATKPRQGRKKRKQRTADSSRASSTDSSSLAFNSLSSSSNIWQDQTEQVDFICTRSNLSHKTVKSIYHTNGARLNLTIRSLAVKESIDYKGVSQLDAITQLHMEDLRNEHPSVDETLVYGVLKLARNIPSAANELLDAMKAPDRLATDTGLGQLNMYSPVRLDDEEGPTLKGRQKYLTGDHGDMRQIAAVNGMAASQAFSQASAAYRRGKSDRLMGGAAAYYASVGHDRVKAAKEYQSAVADAHVLAQSSDSVIDLHGVTVADAVRIASSRTEAWWNGLGDRKFASGGGGPARAGFRIVTGVGTHSKNHAPRIGPAVSKMLVREGWKIEVGRGEILVIGKARR